MTIVGNMSFKTGEDDVWAQFEKCGEIEWVKVATFEDTGKCKGFGWVKFKEPEAAAWAVKGFVKIKEAVETEEDFRDEVAGGDDDNDNNDKEEGGDEHGDDNDQTTQKRQKDGKPKDGMLTLSAGQIH